MAAPTPDQIEESAKQAAKDILDTGVQAYTHGNRSRTHLDPMKMLEVARAAKAMEREDDYGITTLADMRSMR